MFFVPRSSKKKPRRPLFVMGDGPSWPFIEVRVGTTSARSLSPLVGGFLNTLLLPYESASVNSNMFPLSFVSVLSSAFLFSERVVGVATFVPEGGLLR